MTTAPKLWYCRNCGSPEVESLEWVDPNTGRLVDGDPASSSDTSTYCHRCEQGWGIRYGDPTRALIDHGLLMFSYALLTRDDEGASS